MHNPSPAVAAPENPKSAVRGMKKQHFIGFYPDFP
jgi:hypothetical protein